MEKEIWCDDSLSFEGFSQYVRIVKAANQVLGMTM